MLLHLDFTLETPIYQQIRNEIVRRIASCELQPGELLPPIRTLAEDLGINMMTVGKAYGLLKQEGYLQADRRAGSRVCLPRRDVFSPELRQRLELAAAEAKASGASMEDVLEICRAVYEGGERK